MKKAIFAVLAMVFMVAIGSSNVNSANTQSVNPSVMPVVKAQVKKVDAKTKPANKNTPPKIKKVVKKVRWFTPGTHSVGEAEVEDVFKAFPKRLQLKVMAAYKEGVQSEDLVTRGQNFVGMTYRVADKIKFASKQVLRPREDYAIINYGTFEDGGRTYRLVLFKECRNWAYVIDKGVVRQPKPAAVPSIETTILPPAPVIVPAAKDVPRLPEPAPAPKKEVDWTKMESAPAPAIGSEPEARTCFDGNAWVGEHRSFDGKSSGAFIGGNLICRPIPFTLLKKQGEIGPYAKYNYWNGKSGQWKGSTNFVAVGATEYFEGVNKDLTLYQGLAFQNSEGKEGTYKGEQKDVGLDLNAEANFYQNTKWFPKQKVGIDAFIPVSAKQEQSSNGAILAPKVYDNTRVEIYSKLSVIKLDAGKGFTFVPQVNLGTGHTFGNSDSYVYAGPAAALEFGGREVMTAYVANPELHSKNGDNMRWGGLNVNLPGAWKVIESWFRK